MLSQTLITISASIFLLLGTMHLIYTFTSRKFSPRDADLETQMQLVAPRISRQTTMWRAWTGFNASHSLGAMLFGLIYAYLAIFQFALLSHSLFLAVLGGAFILSFLLLAKLYWFRIPLLGIGISLLFYLLGFCVLAW